MLWCSRPRRYRSDLSEIFQPCSFSQGVIHEVFGICLNLDPSGRIDELLEKIAAHFRTAADIFPPVGVGVRAWPVSRYVIADGNPKHTFVNVICRIGAGRAPEVWQAFFAEAYDIVVEHFREESGRRGLGITFYVDEANPEGSWKTNSIGAYMAREVG